ncbi:hypothetical protein [Parvibium lacunae]|nr:hypothetical protein [Parvibium lacunae]
MKKTYVFPHRIWQQLFAASIALLCVNVFAEDVYKDFWVAAEKAPIYDKPNGLAGGEYTWAEGVQAYTKKLKSAPIGWIPLLKYQANPALSTSYLWLRRQDLWDGKPKKVIACWPIKRIEYTVGHWAIEINFKPDGSGVAEELTDIADGNIGPYKTHAYMSQNIVLFSALDKDKRFFFTAGYKPEDRHLYPNGTKEWTEQTLFDEKELKGCTAQPVVKQKNTRNPSR